MGDNYTKIPVRTRAIADGESRLRSSQSLQNNISEPVGNDAPFPNPFDADVYSESSHYSDSSENLEEAPAPPVEELPYSFPNVSNLTPHIEPEPEIDAARKGSDATLVGEDTYGGKSAKIVRKRSLSISLPSIAKFQRPRRASISQARNIEGLLFSMAQTLLLTSRCLTDIDTRRRFILKLARALLKFGAPSHRIESQLTSASEILGANAGRAFLHCHVYLNLSNSHRICTLTKHRHRDHS